MNPIKAVIFDLDGTLADTLADLAAAANYALERCGYPTQPVEAYRYFVGNGIPVMLGRAAGVAGNEAEVDRIKEAFLPYYAEHFCDETTVYPGMRDVIDRLIEKGIQIAVVTNKVDHMARVIVNTLYPGKFPIICGQQAGYPCKPDPALTLAVMAQMAVEPAECLFVGDSDADMQTAGNAGAVAVGALWGFRTREELIENGADYLLEKAEDLLDLMT